MGGSHSEECVSSAEKEKDATMNIMRYSMAAWLRMVRMPRLVHE